MSTIASITENVNTTCSPWKSTTICIRTYSGVSQCEEGQPLAYLGVSKEEIPVLADGLDASPTVQMVPHVEDGTRDCLCLCTCGTWDVIYWVCDVVGTKVCPAWLQLLILPRYMAWCDHVWVAKKCYLRLRTIVWRSMCCQGKPLLWSTQRIVSCLVMAGDPRWPSHGDQVSTLGGDQVGGVR